MTTTRTLRVGDRVKIVDSHRWKPGRTGKIIDIENRTGNRYVVWFDHPELGFYSHPKDAERKPRLPLLLRLSEQDLVYCVEE